MAYLTQAECLDQAIPADAFATLSPTTIDKALLWASTIADSYLGKRYSLPLTAWGEDLKAMVGDLAQYRLLSRLGFRPNSGNDEIAVKRYDDAVKWLQSVSKGDAALAGAVDATPAVDEE